MSNNNRIVYFKNLGVKGYKEALDIQRELFDKIINIKTENRNNSENSLQKPTPNYLLFVEHPHVYTLGKSGSDSNMLLNHIELKAKNATFYKTDRGGDITYHGPGQIVGYPILDLENFSLSLHKYVYNIEESIINTLKCYGLKGERIKGASGVWLDPLNPVKVRKICSVGIRTSRWVSMHGFAFNVNPQLEYFGYINPCGYTDKKVTSIQKELGEEIDINEVVEKTKDNIAQIFQMSLADCENN